MAASMRSFSAVKFVKNVYSGVFVSPRRHNISSICLSVRPHKQPCRCLSTASVPSLSDAFKDAFKSREQNESSKFTLFRTSESDPLKHTLAHTGLYYKMEDDNYTRYMKKGPHEKFHKMGVAFNEHCVMVRKPSIELFDCIRATDLSLPTIRYLIYGQLGVGKSVTLGQTMSHCGRMGWFVVHFPWLDKFVHYPKDVQISNHNKDRVDCPVESAEWLNYFQQMNNHLIPDVKIVNTYTWTKRESTPAGASLAELIEFGVTRTKYATDVVGAVLKEMRDQSTQGNLHALIAIDGANALWVPSKITRIEHRQQQYKNEELSIVHNLRKTLNNDWSGGAIVLIIDSRCSPQSQKESYMPRYLLSKEATDSLEPHIPIHVQNYNKKEAYSCLEYFTDRKWIQIPEGISEEGRREILFLSSQNPLEMYNITSRW